MEQNTSYVLEILASLFVDGTGKDMRDLNYTGKYHKTNI